VNGLQRLPDPIQGELVYLGLGSNLGHRMGFLRQALFGLATHPEISVVAISRVFESEFVGPGTQPPYLNACVAARTTLAPQVLLVVLQEIEARLGRLPGSHWEPRPIDLDILFFGQRRSRDRELTLPHPRLSKRAFVLEPLADIAPHLTLPDSTETVAAACAKIRDQAGPWIKVQSEVSLAPQLGVGREGEWRAALAVPSR